MKILLYDDNKDFAGHCTCQLGKEHSIILADTIFEAKEFLIHGRFDIIISEIKDKSGSNTGIELIRTVRASAIDTPILIIASHSEVSLAVESVKLGAVDFIEKSEDNNETCKYIKSAIEKIEIPNDTAATIGIGKPAMLLVDDDSVFIESLTNHFEESYDVDCLNSFSAVGDIISKKKYDIIILDIRDEKNNDKRAGINALTSIIEKDRDSMVVMLSGWADTATAVEALKLGAADFLEKSINLPETIERIETMLSKTIKPDARDSRKHNRNKGPIFSLIDIVGEGKAIKDIRNEILKVANHDVPVLIYGETGTGKEMVASSIHRAGPRVAGSFIEVNCGSIPESIFESELFGYQKGAFTGATSNKNGKIEAAHGGTLFLDEIENLSLDQQAKLLRILEDKKVYPLGSASGKQVDFRLLCATNIDLRTMVDAGTFREDLFFRINVYYIEIPPLRERGDEDIALLTKHFLMGLGNFTIDDDSLTLLRKYSWPGNVRELCNLVRKLAIIAEDTGDNRITSNIVKRGFRKHGSRASLPSKIDDILEESDGNSAVLIREIEDRAVIKAYKEYNGNISQIAKKVFKEGPDDSKDHREKVRSIIERNRNIIQN